MEQEALQEHINRGREKKFSLTSSCSQVIVITYAFPNFEVFCYMHMAIHIQVILVVVEN